MYAISCYEYKSHFAKYFKINNRCCFPEANDSNISAQMISSRRHTELSLVVWEKVQDVLFGSSTFEFDETIYPTSDEIHGIVVSPQLSFNSIASVLDGIYDLRVPHMLVYVESVKRQEQFHSCILELRDLSGPSILAILSDFDADVVSNRFKPVGIRRGSVMYLQNIAILVHKSPFTRYLVLHHSCFRAILPVKSINCLDNKIGEELNT